MIWAAIVLIPVALLVFQLRSVRTYIIRPTVHQIRESPAESQAEAILFAPVYRELATLGFAAPTWVSSPYSLVSETSHEELSLFAYHPDGIWAHIQLAPLPGVRRPVSVSLLSWESNGHLLETQSVRTHARWPPQPDSELLILNHWSVRQQVDLHRERGPLNAPRDIQVVLSRIDSSAKNALRLAEESGAIESLSEPKSALRPTWRGAWAMLRAERTSTQQATPNLPKKVQDYSLSAIEDAYGDALERYCHRVRPRRKRTSSIVLATTSMCLAGLSFSFWFPLWQVVLFLSVLLLHELGHVIAMRITGHSEASVFFLPFFGAAAIGQKKDSSSAERVFVALMGPLPGLMVAGITLPWILDGTLLDYQVISLGWTLLVAINWLNLAPVLPLDGGHVLNLLLFSRYPGLESAFRLLSFTSLLLIGLWFEQPIVWIAFIAGLLVAAGQHKVAQLADDIRRKPPARSESRFRTYASHMLHRHGHSLQFPTALAVVEATEWRRNLLPLPIVQTMIFLFIYTLAVIIPPITWWLTIHG